MKRTWSGAAGGIEDDRSLKDGRRMLGGGVLSGVPPVTGWTPAPKARKLSVGEVMGQRQRGGPQVSLITDPSTGQRLTNDEATARGPFRVSGWRGGDGSRGRYGPHGGYGGYGARPQSRISSAGVAGGVPTSARGRAEMGLPPDMPAHEISAAQRASSGLTDSGRFGNMGKPMDRAGSMTALDEIAARNTAVTQNAAQTALDEMTGGTGMAGTIAPTPSPGLTDPSAMGLPPGVKMQPPIPFYAEGAKDLKMPGATGSVTLADLIGKRGATLQGGAFVVGDDQLGRPNPELVVPTPGGRMDIVPLNSYMGRSNAPSPNAFGQDAAGRYNDLSARLQAIRAEGMAAGRAAVQEVKERQREMDAIRGTKVNVPEEKGGGREYKTPYGTVTIGGNRPKSFTVDRMEGGRGWGEGRQKYDNWDAARKEMLADSAQRRIHNYVDPPRARAVAATPAVAASATPVVAPTTRTEPNALDEVGSQPTPTAVPLPLDMPSTVESRNTARGFKATAPKREVTPRSETYEEYAARKNAEMKANRASLMRGLQRIGYGF